MRISVIVPVYNCAPWLMRCITSLWNSFDFYPNFSFELIVVDDGSTDESGAILDEMFRKRNNDFKLIRLSSNVGLGAARNRGLNVMTGDWFLFVDADDYVRIDFFEKIIGAIKQTDASLVCYGLSRVLEPKLIEEPAKEETPQNLILDYYDLSQRTMARDAFFRVSSDAVGCTVCFRHDFRDLRFESITPGEDNLFIAAAFIKAKSVAFINNNLYAYCQREGSLMHKKITSLQQIESAGRSMLGRMKYIRNWLYFKEVQPVLRKSFGQTYLLVYGDMLRRVSKDVGSLAWKNYWHYGRLIIEIIGGMPKIVIKIFTWESKFLWFMFLYLPWKGKSFLMRISLIKQWRQNLLNQGANEK